ncbi:hypothetical protein LEP1GSC193_2460 [Leptospira alstonii serovar Pingchang str. 80-412]|uniref:Uncharacterized protein n=2 Tax=Leptospira alstonii TaxID=28452 RepID=M6D2D8_9LEPT|nr:hypothetical protein LEP1GSC194_2497 [Leptospira alstonii serovar Sichuan str. 79601]EQA81034.1 hypothetical protein LEP1GSC193_2460 [Leptospira alstonii serovar Pingchang str. 80-412]
MEFLYSLVLVAIQLELEVTSILKKTGELFKVKNRFSED